MDGKSFTKIMVETNGEMVNITQLPKEQYEEFLELMHQLRIGYIALTHLNR